MGLSFLRLSRYARLAFALLSISIILAILYFGQHILIPLILSLLFAILLRPVVVFFNIKLKFPPTLAIFISVVLFVVFVMAILFFVSWQVSFMTNDWNKIKHNLIVHFESVQHWIAQRFNISYNVQKDYISQIADDTVKGDSEFIGNTINNFTDTVISVILIPVYTFLILLYRGLFIDFLYKIVNDKNEPELKEILIQIKTVVQSYILGLIIETGIVGLLTGIGLMLLGVQYAIFLGAITALLNLIPYVGIIIAALITIVVSLANSNEVSELIGIIILNAIVQILDNNIIVPKIVGNKVSINALASIVGVIIGGVVCGIPGMILSIPVIAILKVIFDHVESLKPWGFLLGNNYPVTNKPALNNQFNKL